MPTHYNPIKASPLNSAYNPLKKFLGGTGYKPITPKYSPRIIAPTTHT